MDTDPVSRRTVSIIGTRGTGGIATTTTTTTITTTTMTMMTTGITITLTTMRETNANTVVPSTPTVNGASVNVTQDM